mmetsp:Transcript_12656/g.38167  ORF Transcript_12656/g.38167 Transcript_12656/m.38167 type:complete len:224 (+) Transcript_12656:2002-2673(+)
MGSCSSFPTTWPKPSVVGPPTNSMMRTAPLPLASAASVSPAATCRAAPVHREGRSSAGVVKASRCSSSSTSDSASSQSLNGRIKRLCCAAAAAAAAAAPCMPAWPGGPLRAAPEMPSCWATAVTEYSLLPRNTYDLAHSVKPSSCTCTCVPYVMSPTCAYSCTFCSVRVSAARQAASSSSVSAVSMTNRYAGAMAGGTSVMVYSIVVNCGKSSAGRLCSDTPA